MDISGVIQTEKTSNEVLNILTRHIQQQFTLVFIYLSLFCKMWQYDD